MLKECDEIDYPHSMTVDDVYKYYSVDKTKGLTPEQVDVQRDIFGYNELDHEEKKSLISLIMEQFEDLLVRILLGAAAVSFILALIEGDSHSGITKYVEPFVILLILIANAAVGVFQETNAEKALDALRALQPELATVLRSGEWESLPAVKLVPGDIVELHAGDKVPADIRISQLTTTTLRIEQSSLTGECESCVKDEDPVLDQSCDIQSKTSMLFSSTTVSNGSAHGIVVRTGMSTEIGQIQYAVKDASEADTDTPLQKKLSEFGEMLTRIILFICLVVWAINYKNFSDPVHGGLVSGCVYYFKIAVALAVAAIPEGLPAVITTCLALGTRKMAQKNAVVRRLPSVETLGCTTVICSDKTGTLTTNQMVVSKFFLPSETAGKLDGYDVTGSSYCPVGEITHVSTKKPISTLTNETKGLNMFIRCCALCNNSKLLLNPTDGWTRSGEPTEVALRVLVEKIGCPNKELTNANAQKSRDRDPNAFTNYWLSECPKYGTLELTRDRKSMSVICAQPPDLQPNTHTHTHTHNGNYLYVKGAPESVLERSSHILTPNGSVLPLTDEWKRAISTQVELMASNALRTLATAIKIDLGPLSSYDGNHHSAHHMLIDPAKFFELETDLVFCGILGVIDPPRPEVRGAIASCREAGIKVLMITGDNKHTAEAIAFHVGILKDKADIPHCSLTGKQFDELSLEDKKSLLAKQNGFVFSRTEPGHKQTIVRILKELNEVTAMTGDGVNDAPALKLADIGIAMGITGTEVAKGASDMVLADDNFNTIVQVCVCVYVYVCVCIF
eukprot:GHVR01165503.1.p1 GENE.GHVR01165503.1~~GHVR01165503.1.p1  ORF type:complete len:790 (+),score=215.97 GHVR01165503.1:175-2544(+)